MSPDKGCHRAIAVAIEAGLPLKIAGKNARARRAASTSTSSSSRTWRHGIEYLGEVTHGEKVELLQDARATLFPIEWEEPFGLVMIESMACGTPVIATRWGAVPEVIDHGRTRDHRRRLPRDGRPRSSAADALDPLELRRYVEERFSPERMVADYVAAYERALDARLSRLRSPYDREILRLAMPALGSLAAEPLYVLVDTAIVGHLGRSQLAALGISAIVLRALFALFNFLSTGRPRRSARAARAGEERGRARLGVAGALALARRRRRRSPSLLAALAEPRRRRRWAATGRPPTTPALHAHRVARAAVRVPRARRRRATCAGSPTCARRS